LTIHSDEPLMVEEMVEVRFADVLDAVLFAPG
jgi:hypothetical protein